MKYLYDLVDAYSVDLVYTALPGDRDGECDATTRTIYIQDGLTYRLHRHTLAHELAHVYYGDVPSDVPHLTAKQERRADEWAALMLIRREDFARAEQMCGPHAPSVAYELGVVTRTVEAFKRTLLRMDSAVYVQPRMGVGQHYAYRQRAA